MIPASGMVPPLSPVLLFGLLARPLPLAPLQPVLAHAMARVIRRHPDVFERLRDMGSPTFLIDPIDLPFCFVLVADVTAPTLRAVRDREQAGDVSATIRGPLRILIAMLEGKLDGDAEFFSRAMTVEGDTSAVVALRNAVDGSEIDLLDEILDHLGPLAGLSARAGHIANRIYMRLENDLECVRRAANGPLERRNDIQAAKIGRLEERLEKLSRERRRERAS